MSHHMSQISPISHMIYSKLYFYIVTHIHSDMILKIPISNLCYADFSCYMVS